MNETGVFLASKPHSATVSKDYCHIEGSATCVTQDRPECLLLRALGNASVDGLVGKKRFHFQLTNLLGMNPPACPVAVKPQDSLDPTPIGLDGARRQLRSHRHACASRRAQRA